MFVYVHLYIVFLIDVYPNVVPFLLTLTTAVCMVYVFDVVKNKNIAHKFNLTFLTSFTTGLLSFCPPSIPFLKVLDVPRYQYSSIRCVHNGRTYRWLPHSP